MNSMNGEIDIEYWRKYHIIWDCFVRSWFDNCKGNQVCKKYRNIADKYRSHAENLEFSELPEPYYGEPSAGVDAVFLNLNPGMLSGESNDKRAKNKRDEKLELQKFYTHIDKSEGWLIQKFRDDCNGSYMRYVKDYSPLKPEFKKNYGKNDEVCGVKWWLGKGTLEDRVEGDATRILWVNRIYGKGDNRIYANDIKPSRVFALEVCPFHSKKWNFTSNPDVDLERFIVDNVIEPALKATCENKLQFAVAVGKTFFDIFEKIKNGQIDGAEASLLGQWCCEKTKGKGRNLKGLMNMISDDSLSKVWPRNKGELTIRSYHLYEVRINNIVARILVTYASGGNTPPSKKFRDVEAKIRKFARECGDTNMRDALAVIKESTMATLQKRDTLELYDFGHEGKTEVTPDKKREIAYKSLKPWPEKHPKHNGNDSHLCYFTGDSRPEAVVLSVKYADRGGSVPGIGFYWNGGGKFNYLDSLKHLRLPEGFRLNEKAINPTTDKGWVSFYKEGCTSAAEMFCQIVDPGTYLEQWGELFKMLMDWAEGNGIGLPQFHTQEKGMLC